MILSIKTPQIGQPKFDIPLFKNPDCEYLFDIKKEKSGNLLFLQITPVVQGTNIAERSKYTIAYMEFLHHIHTDGSLTADELYPLFSNTTNVFKNVLATAVAKDSTLPKTIFCPPFELMKENLQAIVDWFREN